MALNSEQLAAVDCISSGHNLLLLGAAGTGKTFLIKHICKTLKSQNKVVAVTATTGIACCLYDSAQTIHRWSGIGDGRFHCKEIRQVIKNNVKFADVRKKIKNTDVLIIDECSMLSKNFFECLNEICKLKDENQHFGGIQLLLSGDFRQLPPVPNPLYGEQGEFCFESNLFSKVLPHRITLTTVLRQSDTELIHAIHEVSIGNVSAETALFIESLQRPLEKDDNCIKLFSRNEQVDDYNRKCIVDFPGELYEYKSTDEGDRKFLNKILAPQTLWLKKGAPVMLLRNLSDKLVNGLRGTVVDITESGPVVEFPSLNMKMPMEKITFSVFSPPMNTDVAVRVQYPIKLSFAMSIHKSQGLTLDCLEVDCRHIFKPGQLGVALGRARETRGLRVIHFNPQLSVIQQPQVVRQFLSESSMEPVEDISCCRSNINREQQLTDTDLALFTVEDLMALDSMQADTELYDQQPTIEEFDSEFDEIISLITDLQNESVNLPTDLNMETILNNIECKTVKTPMQYNSNKILKEIDQHKYILFCKNEYCKLSSFIEDLKINPAEPVSAKNLSEFYSKVHNYQISAEFRMNCLMLFENTSFGEDHLHICFNISNEIRKYLLKKKAELFTVSQRTISRRAVSNASHARVRYVGGYCIAKIRHKYIQKKRSHMYKTDASGQALFEESVLAVSILDGLKLDEHHAISTTNEPESLLDVSRRQKGNRSLTNISDELFHFFKKLTEICLSLFIDENLNKYGGNLFEHIRTEIMEKSELYNQFCEVVDISINRNEEFDSEPVNKELRNKQISNVYKKIIKLFLMVMVNQFRKDILESFNIQKKMAHRKQIRVSQTDKTKSDKGKESKKKSDLIENVSEDLEQAGHVYKSKGKGRKRKTVSVEREGEEVSEEKVTRGKRLRRKNVRMDSSSDEEFTEIAQTTAAHTKQRKDKDISKSPEAEFINEDIAQPSTSGINVRPAQRSRRNSTDSSTDEDKMKKREEVTELKVTEETGEVGSENIDESEDIDESEEKCKVCDTVNKEFKGEILWIQCDGCNGWLHRACAGLQHHMKWKKATRKGAKFYCCDCK